MFAKKGIVCYIDHCILLVLMVFDRYMCLLLSLVNLRSFSATGPCSPVSNVSYYICVSDCRSRGQELKIDHYIISTVIFFPSADSIKKACCHLQAKVCAQSTGLPLVKACPGKKGVS